jgi:hypothetical protein
MHAEVLASVQSALQQLGVKGVAAITKEVSSWNTKPVFTYKVTVTSKTWTLEITTDKRKKIGKIFTWVDKGTALRGGKGKPYLIAPRKENKSGRLAFMTPHSPKSLPNPAIPGFPSSDAPHLMRPKRVMHPGIYPRNFTKTLYDELSSNKPGAFKSVVEAAIRRGFRRIKSQ